MLLSNGEQRRNDRDSEQNTSPFARTTQQQRVLSPCWAAPFQNRPSIHFPDSPPTTSLSTCSNSRILSGEQHRACLGQTHDLHRLRLLPDSARHCCEKCRTCMNCLFDRSLRRRALLAVWVLCLLICVRTRLLCCVTSASREKQLHCA